MTPTKRPQRRPFPIVPVAVSIIVVALVAYVLLTFQNGGTGDEFGSPTVTGSALPLLPDGAPDPALGMTSPEVDGADFDGHQVSIRHDGTAKIILFLAHWCPHCQREVPIVQDWLGGEPLPDTVSLYTVATSINDTRPNYPPSAWLEREGWTPPVIVDDENNTVGNAYGLTAFPYWVFVGSDGTVLARTTGELPTNDLDAAVAALASS